MNSGTLKRLFVLLWFSCLAGVALAQPQREGFDQWVERRAKELRDAQTAVKINERSGTNQSEAPSASSNSTSLADKSSASDLAGVALNLAGLSSKSSEPDTSSTTVTISAYLLRAAASNRNPKDPAFYEEYRAWRNLSFTLGTDYPEGKEGDPNEKANVFGVKYLPYNKRDATDPANKDRLAAISTRLVARGIASERAKTQIRASVFTALHDAGILPAAMTAADIQFDRDYMSETHWPDTYNRLSQADKKALDDIITREAMPAFADYISEARKVADDIRKEKQISLFFLTKQRKGNAPDEYMAEAIMDMGAAARWNLTFNGAFMYKDNKLTKDQKGGKGNLEMQIQLTPDKLEGRMPLFLTLGAEGSWMTDMPAMYKGQAKLTIPIFDGIDFPISVTIANRTELIDEKDVKGRFGFTFDIARLVRAFKK